MKIEIIPKNKKDKKEAKQTEEIINYDRKKIQYDEKLFKKIFKKLMQNDGTIYKL